MHGAARSPPATLARRPAHPCSRVRPRVQTPLLAALLTTEAASVLLLCGRIMDASGAGAARPQLRAWTRTAERAGLLLFRCGRSHAASRARRRCPPSSPPGTASPATHSTATTATTALARPRCRLLPHLAITVYLALNAAAFASPAYYAMAMGGMLFSNYTNVRAARKLWGPAKGCPEPKLHAA